MGLITGGMRHPVIKPKIYELEHSVHLDDVVWVEIHKDNISQSVHVIDTSSLMTKPRSKEGHSQHQVKLCEGSQVG